MTGSVTRSWLRSCSAGNALTTEEFEAFLAVQPDLSPKAWPRFVRINDDLPRTATNKILKRELIAAGVTAGDGVLWERPERGTRYGISARTSARA